MNISRQTVLTIAILAALMAPSVCNPQSALHSIDYKGGARSHQFDVLHIAIDVKFNKGKKEVIGSVTHRFRSLTDALTTVNLDAAPNTVIKTITVNGKSARYDLDSNGLAIYLPGALTYSDTATIAVNYTVVPEKGLYFIQPDSLVPDRRDQIWTQGEGEDNRYWVPMYDYPNDLATSDLRATVQSDWKLLSNGVLNEQKDNGNGTTTWHYVMDKPHASYLIMLAAGDYMVTRDTANGIPLEYWSYPDMPERVETTFRNSPDAMQYIEGLLGVPYPWNKYSQIMIAEFMYGGMENTTATTLNDYYLVDERARLDYNPDGVIAHEIAHQWYGDLVTNRGWPHLWIHESYATYLASRYMAYKYGLDYMAKQFYEYGRGAIMLDKNIERSPIAGGQGLTGNIYGRGARVLHMLNRMVGEEQFWRANKLFLERHAHGLVETNDLKLAFEDATGLNLEWFFDQWLYKGGMPELAVQTKYEDGSLTLAVQQMQEVDSLTGIFRASIPVEFHLTTGVVSDTIWLDEMNQTFTFQLSEKPRFVIFDAGDVLLKSVDFARTDEELIAQLIGSERMIDRYYAVKDLLGVGGDSDDDDVANRLVAVRNAYLTEKSPIVREEIVKWMSIFDSPLSAEVVERGLRDTEPEVRSIAANCTFRIADKEKRATLLEPLLNDSSYSVAVSALGMMAITRPEGLEPYLQALKGVTNRNGSVARDWLNAVIAGKVISMVDDVVEYTSPRHNGLTRAMAYSVLEELDTITTAARGAIERGLREENDMIRSAAAKAAAKHMDAPMRAMLDVLRNELTGDQLETVNGLIEEHG